GSTSPDDVVAGIVDRAGGNAFYLEELVRAVASGETSALPETLFAMLAARLEAIAPESRRVLRAGAILRQRLWRAGGAALRGSAGRREEIDACLAELEGRELVSQGPESRFAGETELVFRHALVREAAYAMLTEEDRVLGHRLAGAWLEAMGESDAFALA